MNNESLNFLTPEEQRQKEWDNELDKLKVEQLKDRRASLLRQIESMQNQINFTKEYRNSPKEMIDALLDNWSKLTEVLKSQLKFTDQELSEYDSSQ